MNVGDSYKILNTFNYFYSYVKIILKTSLIQGCGGGCTKWGAERVDWECSGSCVAASEPSVGWTSRSPKLFPNITIFALVGL